MSNRVVFSVTVYEDGRMEYTCQALGQPAVDELILRGWLDKVREGVLDAARRAAEPDVKLASVRDLRGGLGKRLE